MKFLKIKIKDFLAIGFVELDFTESTRLLLGKNLDSLAADDNGAGKSSIGEAIRWCLYGETVRSAIDKSLDVQHVIRKGTKKAWVTLEVEVDGVPYEIYRSRMKSKGEFEVRQPGGVVYKAQAAQEALADLLPIDVVQFANLVHLDGSYPRLFAPSTDRDRKEILADLVDIAITQQMQEEATQRLNPLIARGVSLRHKIDTRVTDIARAKEKQKTQQEEGKEFTKKIKGMEGYLLGAAAEQMRLEGEQLRLHSALQQMEDEAVAELEKLKDEYNELVDKVAENTLVLEVCTDSYLMSDLEEAEEQLNSIRTQRDIRISRIGDMQQLQQLSKCPTCGQDTTKALEADIQSLTSQTERFNDELAGISDAIEGITERRQSKVSKARDRRNSLESERNAIDKEIQSLVDVPERKETSRQLTEVRADLKEAEGRVSSLKIKINTKKALVAQLKDQYLDEEKWIKDKHESLEYAKDELIKTDKAIERLSFWKKGFGPKGVPSLFIETVLPQISKRIQKYADILTGGDVLVDLKAYSETKSNTIKEAIQISAVNTKGAAVYGANSTGERNRIDLAVTLGLIDFFRDTGAFESNLLVCDEIFDGLDATGVEQALIALDKADIPSVIVVSHHEHLKPLFPETLYVQKEHGKAELVV